MAIIEGAVSDLIVARDLTDRFHQLIQRRNDTELEPWIADATASMMASFLQAAFARANFPRCFTVQAHSRLWQKHRIA